jgi:hypothetical protein
VAGAVAARVATATGIFSSGEEGRGRPAGPTTGPRLLLCVCGGVFGVGVRFVSEQQEEAQAHPSSS